MEIIAGVEDNVRHELNMLPIRVPRLIGKVHNILLVEQAAGGDSEDDQG